MKQELLVLALRIQGWRVCHMAVACLLLGAVAAASQGAPNYSSSSVSQFIPFLHNNPPLACSPHLSAGVAVTVNGVPRRVKPRLFTMDTGSTGVLISASIIPGYKPSGPPFDGYLYYPSSQLLNLGHWLPAIVTFYGANGSNGLATASVPVLVVEQSGTCLSYQGGNTCPGKNLPPSTRPIAYMGVGFGREPGFQSQCTQGTTPQPQGTPGPSQSTPDRNPLLNLTTVAGQPVNGGTWNQGYIVGSTGVTVGLTPTNTAGFNFIKLTPFPQRPVNDWCAAGMCVQINNSQCYSGSVLVDTGIAQSYITISNPLPNQDFVQVQDPSNSALQVWALAPGNTVTVNLPTQSNPVVKYSYTVHGTKPAPVPVVIPNPRPDETPSQKPPFVNTGRTILLDYQYLYDFKNGYIGLKQVSSGGSLGTCPAIH